MSLKAMSWAWEQHVPDHAAKLVLLHLADFCDENDCSWPSLATIANRCQVSVRTAQRKLAILADSGLITREPRFRRNGSNTSNTYQLLVQHSAPPPRQSVTPGGSRVSPPDPSVEPGSGSKEPSPARDEIWDALEAVFGGVTNANTRGRRNRVVKLLRESQASPEEIRRRARRYKVLYPETAFTDTALANQWDNLAERAPYRPTVCPHCGTGAGLHTTDCQDAERKQDARSNGSLGSDERLRGGPEWLVPPLFGPVHPGGMGGQPGRNGASADHPLQQL